MLWSQRWVRGGDQTDFTGDGTDDILWYNKVTHEIGYSEMKNGQAVRYQQLTGFKWLMDTGWEPAADTYYGDGRGGLMADVGLARRGSSGVRVDNGVTRAGTGPGASLCGRSYCNHRRCDKTRSAKKGSHPQLPSRKEHYGRSAPYNSYHRLSTPHLRDYHG